jgi:hypothetical protein
MAETLKVVMMNQSSVDPVPIAYNSCILHVLEAYQNLRMDLSKREDYIEDLKLSHAKDIKDFEALATQWEMKERDYKTELKKLEVLLSRTEGGLEKVTLARWAVGRNPLSFLDNLMFSSKHNVSSLSKISLSSNC